MADAKAKLAAHFRDLVDPDLLGDFVVEHVAAFRERAREVHPPMPAAFPAVEAAVAEFDVAGAGMGGFGGDQPFFQRGKGGDHLEGRSRRIGTLHGLVGQGAVVVFHQGGIVALADAAHEKVGVKAGGRGAGDDFARLHVHHHAGGAFLAQTGLNEVLHIGVDGQLHVLTRRAVDTFQLAHDAADVVHLDPLVSGRAAQGVFHPAFDADLADLEFGDAQDGVGVGAFFKVAFADRADIADDMAEIGDQRVVARQADLWRDAGQGGGVQRDLREILPCQAIGHDDGHEGRVAVKVAGDPLHILGREGDEACETSQHGINIARPFAGQGDAVVLFIARDQAAVAIEDQAALGRDQADVDAVLFGQKAKFIGLFDRKIAHPCAQNGEHGDHCAAHQQGAAVDAAGAFFGVAGGASHGLSHSRRP